MLPGLLRRSFEIAAFSSVAVLVGCTARGGQMLYMLGFGKAPMIEAQFRLTDEPVLIFVDDIHECIDWPQTERYIFDELSQALLRNKAAKRIVPLETVDQLRQVVEDFNKRGCREIGELAGATQVLWLEVRDFLADEQIGGPSDAAFIGVTVKVIDVTQKESRTRVRLWPVSPEGQFVSVSLSGAEAAEADTKADIAKELAIKLADAVASLFYDYRADDFAHDTK